MQSSLIDLTSLPNKAPDFDLMELFEAGVHFGHQVDKWNPKMAPYIFTEKGKVHIFNLEKTVEQLKVAYNVAYQLGATGKTLVVVGTKKQARDLVETICAENNVLYIASRWLGGILTNWEQVKRSLRRMLDIEEGLKTGKFDKYTKYERLQMEKEMGRLERFFVGIRELKGMPDALFIIDLRKEKNAIKESTSVGLFTIGLVDTNADPTSVDVVIPGNDDGVKSIELILKTVVAGYKAGMTAEGKVAAPAGSPEKTVEKPAAPVAEKPVAKVVEKAVEAKVTKPAEKPKAEKAVPVAVAKKPTAKVATKPAVKVAEKTPAKTAAKPAVKPAKKAAGKAK